MPSNPPETCAALSQNRWEIPTDYLSIKQEDKPIITSRRRESTTEIEKYAVYPRSAPQRAAKREQSGTPFALLKFLLELP